MLLSSRVILVAISLLLAASSALRAQTQAPKQWAPVPQELVVAYWTLEPGWATELEMRNNVPWHDLRITPVLRTAEGTEVPLTPVDLKPDETVSVNLQDAVASAKPELLGKMGAFGSVVLRFDGTAVSNAFGACAVRREGHPIDFHFDADGFGSHALEGMWWLPSDNSTDYLIISNPTHKAVTARLMLSNASGAVRRLSVTLAPGQTQRTNVRELLRTPATGTVGGLSLSVAKDGAISANEIVFDEVTGFAAVMKLFDREAAEKVGTHVLRAPMMAFSQPDPSLAFPQGTSLIPRIFLRNAGSDPMDVSAAASWRSDTSARKFELPPVTLMPGQMRIVSVGDFQRPGQIPVDATWGTITLGYRGRGADLVAIAVSYDKNGRYGLQTPFTEGTNRLFKGSMWHVDGTRNTLITTGNGGTEPTRAQVTIFYNAGQGKYRVEKSLSPGEQIWLNLGELIRNQVADSDGRTLPPDTMFGSYELRDLDHRGVGLLYEGKLVVDKSYGHASYGCAVCCGYRGTRLTPNPFTGPPGMNNPDEFDAYDVCGAFWDDFTWVAYNWRSSNTAVATLPNSTLHTVAPGSFSGLATVYLPIESGHCPNSAMGGTQPGTVTPTVSISGTSYIPLLATGASGPNSTSLTATGSPAGGTFAWSITNGSGVVSLSGTGQPSSTKVTSLTTGTATVQVQYTLNSQSATATKNIVVQKPAYLSIVPGSSLLNQEATCTPIGGGNGCGTGRSFVYQALDQSGLTMAIQGMQFWDSITTGNTNSCSLSQYTTTCTAFGLPQSGPCGQITDNYGQFNENLSICSTVCKSGAFCTTGCSTTAQQTWNVNGFPLTADIKALAFYCNNITVNGN